MNIIESMAYTNEHNYNIDKTIEEIFELGEVLMKRKLKAGSPKAPSTISIIEEIGDVQIRLDVLKLLLGPEAVENRIKEKLAKYEEYYREGKYIGRI